MNDFGQRGKRIKNSAYMIVSSHVHISTMARLVSSNRQRGFCSPSPSKNIEEGLNRLNIMQQTPELTDLQALEYLRGCGFSTIQFEKSVLGVRNEPDVFRQVVEQHETLEERASEFQFHSPEEIQFSVKTSLEPGSPEYQEGLRMFIASGGKMPEEKQTIKKGLETPTNPYDGMKADVEAGETEDAFAKAFGPKVTDSPEFLADAARVAQEEKLSGKEQTKKAVK